MAIRSKEEINHRPIEINLTGPDGNAYVLLGLASNLSKRLGFSEFDRECILDEMRLSDYEGLIQTFDRYFGSLVILYR